MLLNYSLLRRMQFLFQEPRMFLLLALQDLNVHYLQVLGNSREAVVQNLSLLCYIYSEVHLITLQKVSDAEMTKSFGC